MKPIFKLIIPTIFAIILIVVSLLFRKSSTVLITLESKRVTFTVNQTEDQIKTSNNGRDSTKVIVPFTAHKADEIEILNFDHIFFEGFNLYINSTQKDSLKKIRENASFKLTPIVGRWKKFAKVNFEAQNECSFSIQSTQFLSNSFLDFECAGYDWLSISIQDTSITTFENENPIIRVILNGKSYVTFEKCNFLEMEKMINEISDDTNILIAPYSEYSTINIKGENKKVRFRTHFPSKEFQSYSKVEAYDPKTDNWRSNLEPLPTPRLNAVTAVVDDKIYVLGGDRREQKVELLSDVKANQLSFEISEDQNSIVNNININYIDGIRETFSVTKAVLNLNDLPYTISNIELGKNKIICTFQGETSGSSIDSGNKHIVLSPTLFEWIYKNNVIFPILAAIVWLIGTIYTIIKEWEILRK